MQLTQQVLCGYFRQFGAIERVQILPERLKLWELRPPLYKANIREATAIKHFAYVTFVNCLGVVNAVNARNHEIGAWGLTIRPAYSWHQPNADNIKLPTPNACASNNIVALKTALFDSINESLNDDCISHIMSYLNVFELIDMAKHSPRYTYLSQQQRTIRIVPNITPNMRELTLLNLRQILRLHGFGYSALHITISSKALKCQQSTHDVINKMVQYIGPQLRSLVLQSFNVVSSEFAQLKSILLNLQHLEIDLNYNNFDYGQFNDVWPNLRSLRLESSGAIHVVQYKSTATTEFAKLTSLVIVSRYKLYEHLFENIFETFKALKTLVIINVHDYYTELNATIPTDFMFVAQLQHLTKLHISFGQHYLRDDIWQTLGRMGALQHLTIEVGSQRNNNLSTITESNFNAFCRGVRSLVELRVSGFKLSNEHLVGFVRSANWLDQLAIHNCGLEVADELINSLVAARIAQLRRRAHAVNCMGSGQQALQLTMEQPLSLNGELVRCGGWMRIN